jgi:predicted DNA-binding transcriptional regulator AlpA
MADPIDHQPEAAKPKRTLPADIEPMVGIDGLAAWLGCSRRLVERMRSGGKVPKPDIKIGKMPRWKAATIRAWIERGGKP